MLALTTNIGAFVLVALLLVAGLFMEKFSWRRFTIKNIALLGVLVALSIILTNIIGYNIRIFGSQIMIGNFVIFLSGMVFGPLSGIITGICADIVGFVISPGGAYHAGFMSIKVLYGFAGALVFLSRSNKWWAFKMVALYAVTLTLQLFALTPLFLWSLYGTVFTAASMIKKIIIFPVELILYPALTYTTFGAIWVLLKNDVGSETSAWIARNGNLHLLFKPKRSELEKLQNLQTKKALKNIKTAPKKEPK